MKKFYFLATAAIVLASCTNEESVFDPTASQEVSFHAVVSNATRSAVSSSSAFQAPIYVAAGYQPNATSNYSNLFGVEFVKFENNMSGVWQSATPYYFPSDGQVDFLAYTSGSTTGSDEVVPTATVTRSGTHSRFSNLKLDYTTNELEGKTDVMYSAYKDLGLPYSTASVPLTFKHTLAWISIQMDSNPGTVLITSLKANNVVLTGTVNIPVVAGDPGDPAWTPGSPVAEVPFSAFCPATPTLVENLIQSPEGILVVPGNQTQLTIVYQLASNPGVDITHVVDLTPYNSSDGPWVAGKHYTYSISFSSLNQIKFSCSVEPYTEWSTPDDIRP